MQGDPAVNDPGSLVALLTTVATRDDADRLAAGAVEAGLAACVHLDAIDSVYRWQGALQRDAEWRLLFKTTPEAADGLHRWLLERHPYEVPMLARLALADPAPAYRDWVRGLTGGA